MDGRRRQWIAIDVNFLGSDLGSDLMQEFGAMGPVTWLGVLCACKRNGVQGQMTYTNESDALAQMGLIGMELTRPLEDVFAFLGRRRQVRRSHRGRLNTVVVKNWEKWQKPPFPRGGKKGDADGVNGSADDQQSDADEKESDAGISDASVTAHQRKNKSRSSAQIADELETIVGDDSNHDFDLDPHRDRCSDPDTAPPPADAIEAAIALHHNQAERRISNGEGEGQLKGFIERLAAACIGQNPAFIRLQAIKVIAICNEHGPELAIAAAIREAEIATGGSRLKLPQGLFPVFDRERVKRGLPPLYLRLPEIGKKVS